MSRGALSAEIRRLAASDYDPRKIAVQVGTSPFVVRSIVSKARRKGLPVRNLRRDRMALTHAGRKLTDHVLNRLGHEAHSRQLGLDDLIAEILTVMAEDGLFDAILERADDRD